MNDMIFTHFTFFQIYESLSPWASALLYNSWKEYNSLCLFCVSTCVCVREREYCVRLFVRVCGSFSKSLVMFACLLVSSCCPLYPQTHHTLSEGWLWTNMHACGCVRMHVRLLCVCVCMLLWICVHKPVFFYACVCA